MEPTSLPDVAAPAPAEDATGDGHTRRSFIRGIAAAGASTAAVAALDRAGVLDLATAEAQSAGPNAFSSFRAIAPSGADALQVPEGYRADVIIGYGDPFTDADGQQLVYGYNNDFLAYFPLKGSDEGVIFVNHEYPSPFFIHGETDPKAKTREQIALEQESVGNSVVHIRKDGEGLWRVVSPSFYNRRITGAGPRVAFTGPLAAAPDYPGIGTSAAGTLANCSGGITPWGTALTCEENFQDYGSDDSSNSYGWTPAKVGTFDYVNGDGSTPEKPAKYGWVMEVDPMDPSSTPRKHTALGRFRHENTAFRADANRRFVLYMGDDRTDGGVYKFVSDLAFRPGRRAENDRILESGTLYIARWEPEGRRRFANAGETTPLTATSGTGTWREVARDELVDTHARIRAAVGDDEFLTHHATNRPEDLEVDEDGLVYIALTNNSNVKDTHGSIRRLREAGNDATAGSFTWEEFAAGGPSGRADAGEQGFSSPDNLVFDKAGNLWVVTDISSSKLGDPTQPEAYHANNAIFMVPRTGPNAGVAYRFGNMPVEAEGTGPYFTPTSRPCSSTSSTRARSRAGGLERRRPAPGDHLLLATRQQDDRSESERAHSPPWSPSPRWRPPRARARPGRRSSRSHRRACSLTGHASRPRTRAARACPSCPPPGSISAACAGPRA
jgi:secreted PhoX family phosphatase